VGASPRFRPYYFLPFCIMRSLLIVPFFLFIIVFITACSEQKKDYLPGELEYDKSVEAAEFTINTIAETGDEPSKYCGSVQDDYDQGVTAFERLMPNLKGMDLRNRDMRLQAIREFLEQYCSNR